VSLPVTTMLGALIGFISSADPKHFQPMSPNFGIFPALPQKVKSKQERYGEYRDRSFADLAQWSREAGVNLVMRELAISA
jgi:methylenetetrahydrofolate--tRNA-(uracil-5-)-methyltransferase